jgi:y4mF family transcriptional regulator
MHNSKAEIGQLIRQRREILGLLQEELANISGVSLRTIQMIEKAKANPSINTMMQVADPLGLSLQLTLKHLGNRAEK